MRCLGRGLALVTPVAVLACLISSATCFAGPTLGVEEVSRELGGYTYKGACIQHKQYRLELREGVFQVPVLTLYWAGPYRSLRERAERVAADMEHAFDLMEMGGTIEVANGPDGNPGIWVRGKWDFHSQGHLIMTIYPDDAKLFPRAIESQQRLAEYVQAIISAHYIFFIQNSLDIADYDALDLDKRTGEGKIFKAVFLEVRNLFLARNENIGALRDTPREERPAKLRPTFQETVQIVSVEQRLRLYLLAFLLPRDW